MCLDLTLYRLTVLTVLSVLLPKIQYFILTEITVERRRSEHIAPLRRWYATTKVGTSRERYFTKVVLYQSVPFVAYIRVATKLSKEVLEVLKSIL